MQIKLRYIVSIFVVGIVLAVLFAYRADAQLGAGNGTISQLSQWLLSGGYVKTSSSTAKLWVPGLASSDECIKTDATGKTYTGACGSGGSLSGGSTNALTYWTSGSTVGATTSPTIGYLTATSTASSTFAGPIVMQQPNYLVTHGVQSVASDGISLRASNGTNIATLGSGGGANATFYDGLTNYGAHTAYGLITGQYFTATSTTQASTFPYGSSTAFSASRFWGPVTGDVTGTASFATALAANGGNCTAGSAPLGVDASGAVESCFDVWTEAENTAAAYINASALTPYLTLAAFYATTTADIAEGGSNLYYSDARVNSYIHGSSTIPKTYTANSFTATTTFAGLQVTSSGLRVSSLNAASCDIMSTTNGDFYCGTNGSGGGSISGWATTTSSVAGQLNLYPTNSTDILNIGGSATTSSEFWCDPNTVTCQINGSNGTSSMVLGAVNDTWIVGTAVDDKSFVIASSSDGRLTGTTKFSIGKSGTTTSTNGFNITEGCYAVNGVCITSGGGTWGSITGTLSSQTDLQTALNLKIDNSTTTLPRIGTLTGLGNIGSSSATTTFAGNAYVSGVFRLGSDYVTDVTGTGIILSAGALTLDTSVVGTYIHASSTIPKTYTTNTYTALQTIPYASTTVLSASNSLCIGTDCRTSWPVGGSGGVPAYSIIVDADGGGDFTTIQGALDGCAAVGGGSIFLSDPYYYVGGTGLLFKSNDCNVYGVYASTTIEVAGATTAFKTNSPAGTYANVGVHNVVIVGDGTAGSVGIDMSDMIRSRYTGIIMDNLDIGFKLNDTQNVTFYNTVRDFAITTMGTYGIYASSTNPTNDNKFSDGFIGCTAGCTGIHLNNAQANSFSNVSIEPGSTSGTIGVKIETNAAATNNGTFANKFFNLYAEANGIGIAASSSIGTKIVKGNTFDGGQIVANTVDVQDSSNGTGAIQFNGAIVDYEISNSFATTTVEGSLTASVVTADVSTSTFAGLQVTSSGLRVSSLNAASCDLKATTNGDFYCGTDATGAGASSYPTWATSTSQVAAQLTVSPYNTATDILTVGSNSTTTAFFSVDPIAQAARLMGTSGTSTITLGTTTNAWTLGTSLSDYALRIASSTGLLDGATALFTLTKNGFLGLGSTTPWGKLSVVNTDTTKPIVSLATSTAMNSVMSIWATTTDVSLIDYGRVIIGQPSNWQKIASMNNGLLDPLNVSRINTGDWFHIKCEGDYAKKTAQIAADITGSVLSTTVGYPCGDFSFIEDANHLVDFVTSQGSGYIRIRPGLAAGTNAAGDGGGLALTTGFMRTGTSTPILEGSFNVLPYTSTTSVYFFGFTSATGVNADYAAHPTGGCYITASTTQNNWRAVCKDGNNITIQDTGFASTTVSGSSTSPWLHARIEVNSTQARFYMATSTNEFKVTNVITTNIPTATTLNPVVSVAQVSAGGNSQPDLWVKWLRGWYKDPAY